MHKKQIHFKRVDPFNPKNEVEGILFVDEVSYGDLHI